MCVFWNEKDGLLRCFGEGFVGFQLGAKVGLSLVFPVRFELVMRGGVDS